MLFRSASSPTSSSAEAATNRSRPWKPTSAPGPTDGTKTPSHSSGPNQPNRSSSQSADFLHGSPVQDTRDATRARHPALPACREFPPPPTPSPPPNPDLTHIDAGRAPKGPSSMSASKIGSSTILAAACTIWSRPVRTVISYCDPFHVVCGLGLHFGGKLVAVGDPLFTAGLQVGREVDPSASALAAAGG